MIAPKMSGTLFFFLKKNWIKRRLLKLEKVLVEIGDQLDLAQFALGKKTTIAPLIEMEISFNAITEKPITHLL